ncbi:hypothetical protein QRX56_05975, partial [Staphylococcus aureus]
QSKHPSRLVVVQNLLYFYLIFMNGKEMHRQGRFIDMQRFEHHLKQMNDSVNNDVDEH